MLQEENLLQVKDAKITELRELLSLTETFPVSMDDTCVLSTSQTRNTTSSHECVVTINSPNFLHLMWKGATSQSFYWR